MDWAVELRHRDWFEPTVWHDRVNNLLQELDMDRVIFDATYLHKNKLEPKQKSLPKVANQIRLLSRTLLLGNRWYA